MTRRHRHLDEDDVRIRPGRSKSRPRSKVRPAHSGAVTGFVTTVDRGRFTVRTSAADGVHAVFAVKARELGRKGVVVGDRVSLVGDLSGGPNTLARIVSRKARTTVLRRSADDDDPAERILVANADQLGIVVSVADPTPRRRWIDRALVAAYDGGLDPLLVITKTDLTAADALCSSYAALQLHIVTTRRDDDLSTLRAVLRDHQTVLLGQSGVGKSTLVNALVPDAARTTGQVNAVTRRGRHTSTSAVALELPFGGWVVDTPGIRSLGLAHVDLSRLLHAFPDLAPGAADCPRGCGHEADEQECALDDWVAQGHASTARLASLRRLLASRSGSNDESA